MSLTKAQMRTLVREATRRTDKDTLIDSALDLAVQEVSAQRLWIDLQVEAEVTLLAGSESVTLADDVIRISEMRLIEGTLSRPLLVRPKTWLVDKFPAVETQSNQRPVYGYLEGLNLHTIPIPDVDYTIRYTYYRLHPTLDTDISTSVIRGVDGAIVAYAIHWTFQSLGCFEDANQWLGVYMQRLQSAEKVDSGNSVIKFRAEQRGEVPLGNIPYWLDPFCRSMP